MFEPSEATTCPECGLPLKRLEDLPATKVVADELEPELPPDEETLPWTYAGRGRASLLVIAALGIAVFFLPWATLTSPERVTLTGAKFAGLLGWMWAPLVSWMVLVPLVVSRRSIYKMRGARVATAFLCAMALLTVVVRIAFPPSGTALDPLRLEWEYGIWATGLLGIAGLVASLRFGGRIDDLTTRHDHRAGDETLH